MPVAPRRALKQARGAGQVLTFANGFTAVRLACIPLFVWLMLRPHHAGWYAAAWLLAGLGATDWVDGQLARRLNQVSTLGKVLDPLADRLLLVVAVVAAIAIRAVPLWVAAVAAGREVFVGAGFLVVAIRGSRRMDVSLAGKAGTFLLMVALPLFLVARTGASWRHGAHQAAWIAAVPGMAIGWLAAFDYTRRARGEGETRRTAVAEPGERV